MAKRKAGKDKRRSANRSSTAKPKTKRNKRRRFSCVLFACILHQLVAMLKDANVKLDYITKNLPRFNHTHA